MASRQLHHRGFRDGLNGVDAEGMPLLRRRRGRRQRGLRVLMEVVMPLVRRRKLRIHVGYQSTTFDLCKALLRGVRVKLGRMQTGRSGPRRGLGEAVGQASCMGALSTEPELPGLPGHA